MSEGGILPWKVQKIDSNRGEPVCYDGLSRPLPDPPKGCKWDFDETVKEWKVVSSAPSDNSKNLTLVEPVSGIDTACPMNQTDVKDFEFLEHKVSSTDTIQGICLKYRISATALRQANRFSGSNLLLAPSTLVIPLKDGKRPAQLDPDSKEYKLRELRKMCPSIGTKEATVYLELADWILADAVAQCKADIEWESKNTKKQ